MGVNLDKIIQDLLLIIRGSSISESEPISKRQIEDWVHQYRALLLKRDIDKGYAMNPDYIQEVPNRELESILGSEDNNISSECYIFRTKEQLPKAIDTKKYNGGITYIGTILGNQIQLLGYNRFQVHKNRKYTGGDLVAFIRNQYVYVSNNELLEYINIRGIFENPLELSNLTNIDIDYRFNYPIPMDKISTLKQMILQGELGIESQSFSDEVNDSNHGVSPQTEGVRYTSTNTNKR